MAYDITYNDFNGDETQILIYKGVEGGVVNDYVARVESDITHVVPSPYYEGDNVSDVVHNTGLGHDQTAIYLDSYDGESSRWDAQTYWYFQFTVDGVVSDLLKYKFNAVGIGGAIDQDEGDFNVSTNNIVDTATFQINIIDSDGNNHAGIFANFTAERDTLEVFHDDSVPSTNTPVLEGLDCLKYKIGILDGTGHSFCGTDNPLMYKYYSENKYSNIMASEVELGIIIKDVDDHTAMKQILDGGYYISVYKNGVAKWLGKLTSRFYVEAYAQYPYPIKLSGSDQLGSFERYQPLMIDFPIPDEKVNIISLLGKFLMDSSMYGSNYVGDRITQLYFSSRFTESTISKIASDLYLDPLNWMKEDTQYESKKDIVTDILKALHAKLFQWNYRWYVMDFESQWDAGEVTWNTYAFDNNGVVTEGSDVTEEGHFVRPYISNPTDIQVFNNAEMRYEPSWRMLDMNLNYNERKNDIAGFANILGNFYEGHDGVNLEIEYTDTRPAGKLRYWSGDDFIFSYGSGNNGWIAVKRESTNKLQYINSTIPMYDYDKFIFNITMLGVGGLSTAHIYMIISLTMGSETKYLNNAEGANNEFNWVDVETSIYLEGNEDFTIEMDLPFESVTNDIVLYTGIRSLLYDVVGWTVIKELKANFISNQWEGVGYKQTLDKSTGDDGADTQITKIDYNWGLYHETLPNQNNFHRSSAYYKDGEPIPTFEREGETGDISLMDWVGNILIGDNSKYTPTLTASYFSKLSPLSLMVDAEGFIYRFVSGEFNDKTSTWRNIYTKFKGIKNISSLPVRCDYSPLDYSEDDYCIEFSTLYLKDYVVRISEDGGTLEAKECVEIGINELN